MMMAGDNLPVDIEERIAALTDHASTILVEAGAGSGKTSVLAGRVALMIAGGVPPDEIAAITFTEAAAAELRERIVLFLEGLARGEAPRDLRAALPDGVSEALRTGAEAGLAALDGLLASTLHGFAQALIKPYPLEAGMDPGATIADPEQASMAFDDAVETWMRSKLQDDAAPSFLGALFKVDAGRAETSARGAAHAMRRGRGMLAPDVAWDAQYLRSVVSVAEAWIRAIDKSKAKPEKAVQRRDSFAALLASIEALPEDRFDLIAETLMLTPERALTTAEGDITKLTISKTDWEAAGKEAGWGTTQRKEAYDTTKGLWDSFRGAWEALKEHCAGVAARYLTMEAREALCLYADWKRSAALLDFDDLLIKARDLLAAKEDIRQALGRRFTRILVDEFQDTEPLQTEILFRLAGDPRQEPGDWKSYQLRPGSLFIVGDPKQAIYRFRGADIKAYFEAKTAIGAMADAKILSISVNFRSTRNVISWVNETYSAHFGSPELPVPGQADFQALSHFRTHETAGVQGLEVIFPADLVDAKGRVNSETARRFEADAVADLLRRLVGSMEIEDGNGRRFVRPGDIALLAPVGTALWIYETALERAGLPVAPQAGKGFLNRQEVLDLIALCRILADPRDSLALGAFLRGPLIGFTDEEILDGIGAMPKEGSTDGARDGRRRLSLWMEIENLPEGRFKDVIGLLRTLQSQAQKTTPFQVLSSAMDIFCVKAVLRARYPRSHERAFANIGAFLHLSRAWDALGIKSFGDEMRRRLEDDERQAEGRPDASEQSISVITQHSSKGLEWPIVACINLSTGIRGSSGAMATGQGILMSILGHAVAGYTQAANEEKEERKRERVRLLYVSDTRARDLLIIPAHSHATKGETWWTSCNRGIEKLPSFDATGYPEDLPAEAEAVRCSVGSEDFKAAAGRIAAAKRHLTISNPSRHDVDKQAAERLEGDFHETEIVHSADLVAADVDIQGGPIRGILMHKLFEEILTSEVGIESAAERATALYGQLGRPEGIDPGEVAAKVCQALDLPEVKAYAGRLVPELDIYGLGGAGNQETLSIGIGDAVGLDADGHIEAIFDWKSDVKVEAAALARYRIQVAAYKANSGAKHGFIVFATTGQVVMV